MVDYIGAIKRPFSDSKKLLLGLLFSVIPIVNFIGSGYQLECCRSAYKNKLVLPEWKNYGELFIKGILNGVIWTIYSIPVIAVFLYVVWSSLFTLANLYESDTSVFLAELIRSVGYSLIAIVLLGILTTYVCYYASVRFAMNYKFKEAFEFKEILKGIVRKEYSLAWLVAGIYSLIIGLLLGIIPFIGSGIAGFLSGVTFMTVLGQVYKEQNL